MACSESNGFASDHPPTPFWVNRKYRERGGEGGVASKLASDGQARLKEWLVNDAVGDHAARNAKLLSPNGDKQSDGAMHDGPELDQPNLELQFNFESEQPTLILTKTIIPASEQAGDTGEQTKSDFVIVTSVERKCTPAASYTGEVKQVTNGKEYFPSNNDTPPDDDDVADFDQPLYLLPEGTVIQQHPPSPQPSPQSGEVPAGNNEMARMPKVLSGKRATLIRDMGQRTGAREALLGLTFSCRAYYGRF